MGLSNEQWSRWSSKVYQPQHQFEAWYAALNASHLSWSLNKPLSPEYYGEMTMRSLGEMIRIVQCQCDPCSGIRTQQEIVHDNEGYFGLLLIQEGNEIIKHKSRESCLHPGDMLLWDSTHSLVNHHLSYNL